MTELALDDDQWHALARHLDGMAVPEPSARGAVDDADQRSAAAAAVAAPYQQRPASRIQVSFGERERERLAADTTAAAHKAALPSGDRT